MLETRNQNTVSIWLNGRAQRRIAPPIGALLIAVAVLACAPGCSTTHYRESADREVYGLISQRASEVPGMPADFTIEEGEVSLEGLPKVGPDGVEEYLAEAGEAEIGSHILSLEKALEIAVNKSRRHQNQQESLYLQALSFTETRQDYRPVLSGGASGTYAVATEDVVKRSGTAEFLHRTPTWLDEIGGLTGGAGDILSAYADIVEAAATVSGANATETAVEQTRSASGQTSFSVDVLMKGGAQIALGLTSNFFRFLKGDSQATTASSLVASITQPLWGANRRTALETFTQAERDLLYSLRSFTRFRKSFSIDIASSYYRVLQSRDAVRNSWLGYQAFKKNLERAEAEAEAGRITKTDLGRTREQELQSRNDWVTAVQAYQDALDRFKIDIGLSTDAPVVLDDGELDRLMGRGLMPQPVFTLEDAVQVAFAARLDYYTERDQLDDATRKLQLAIDGLSPDLAASLTASVDTEPGENVFDFDFDRYVWSLGLDLDPKLNRKRVRNDYRRSLISYAQSRRGLDLFEDNVKLELRQAWRTLEQARISFEIQQRSLAESERRVLEQELLFEAGRGKAIDQIDAQNALIAARNRVSAALVDHTIANLRLWLNMGILYIKEDGQWEDITDVDRYRTSVSTS